MDGTRVVAVMEMEDDGTASLSLPWAHGFSLLLMGVHHQPVEFPVLPVGGSHADLSVRRAPGIAAWAPDSSWVIIPEGAVLRAMEPDARGGIVPP